MRSVPGPSSTALPPPAPITVFVGNYGSGKTEIAINYALHLAQLGEPVQLVDLDIVNPYFRSREAREYVGARGVEVVAPTNEYASADLPIILREVAGALGQTAARVVLDVGGDDLGARVLGGFSATLNAGEAVVLQVVNERRPFTDSLQGCRRMYDELEAASRMKIRGLVANAHLIAETNAAVVRRGVDFAREMSEALGVPLAFAAVERGVLEREGDLQLGCPLLPLDRFMTSPWEASTRRGPIGRPPQVSLPEGVK